MLISKKLIISKLVLIFHRIFRICAYFFGYPYNKGILKVTDSSDFFIPYHITFWPVVQPAFTWSQVAFTPAPQMNLIRKFISKEFYVNFFIDRYKNINFLPTILSWIIQVYLNIFYEDPFLEKSRKYCFLIPTIYTHMINMRIGSSWFGRFSPFIYPWKYLFLSVDTVEGFVTRFLPIKFFQVSIELPFLLFVSGFIADQVNHLVYTIPYLPSEVMYTSIFNKRRKLRPILFFSNIPVLWCKFQIPNLLKRFWHSKHLNIIEYLSFFYTDLNINALPDKLQ